MAACPVRRRGDALMEAIFTATIEILAESGYSGLSMEAVAHGSYAFLLNRTTALFKIDTIRRFILQYGKEYQPASHPLTRERITTVRRVRVLLAGDSNDDGAATAAAAATATRT